MVHRSRFLPLNLFIVTLIGINRPEIALGHFRSTLLPNELALNFQNSFWFSERFGLVSKGLWICVRYSIIFEDFLIWGGVSVTKLYNNPVPF